jgi:hypothetical protein
MFYDRTLNIKQHDITDYGFNFIKFKVKFSNITEVSLGGIDYPDDLFFIINQPQLFRFKDIEEYNALEDVEEEFEPLLNIW